MKLKSIKHKKDVKNGRPNGSYIFKVSVFDEDGVSIEGAVINMKVNNKLVQTKKSNGRLNVESDWDAHFEYVPQRKGKKNIQFESDGDVVVKDVDVK